MTKVDFHILSQPGDDARLRHACTLVEKAQKEEQRVFVRGDDANLRRMDELLWSFHDHAFIPHQLMQSAVEVHPRMVALLGLDQELPRDFQILINLDDSLPPQLDQATQIYEVVDVNPARKQQARERYKQYRDRGCSLETHNQ